MQSGANRSRNQPFEHSVQEKFNTQVSSVLHEQQGPAAWGIIGLKRVYGWVVGKPCLGITSCLPVIRPQSTAAPTLLRQVDCFRETGRLIQPMGVDRALRCC